MRGLRLSQQRRRNHLLLLGPQCLIELASEIGFLRLPTRLRDIALMALDCAR